MLAHCVPHVLRTCPSQHAVGSLHLPFIGWWVGHFMEKSRKKKIFHSIYVFWAVLNFFLKLPASQKSTDLATLERTS